MRSKKQRKEPPPRWATRRTGRPTYGRRLAAISKVLGQPFRPWQQQVADVALEYDPKTGLIAYPVVIVTVPRQTGKTTVLFAAELDRCIYSDDWGGPQRVVYSAQTGWDARLKLLEDQVPVLEESPLMGFVKRILRGMGNESIKFKTGSRIALMSGDKGAGHGRSLDLGIIDEAFDDVDDRREGAMVPAMRSRRNAQRWVASTAGTDESIYLQRLVKLGRAAVEEGRTEGIAYFEWSVPKEDEEDYEGLAWDDPETWHRYIPALDETAERQMLQELGVMKESEFRRGFLNQWMTLGMDRVISAEHWEAVNDLEAKPTDPVVMALDINEERTKGALVGVGGGVGELIRSFDGMSSVVETCARVCKKNKARLVIDKTGPAVSLVGDLKKKGVKVIELSGPDVAIATAQFFDAVVDGNIRVRQSHQFDAAAGAVRKKAQGDRFVWKRTVTKKGNKGDGVKTPPDVTPIIALTLAFGAPQSKPVLFAATT